MITLPPDPALARFIKPTIDTPFHIDYEWWERQKLDLNVEMQAHLCSEHREAYAGQRMGEKIDWVDWETGEIQQVAGLQYVITSHCSKLEGYVMQAPTIIGVIFRVFLSNGNQPLSPRRLAPLVGQRAEQVLLVLAGKSASKGLRPVLNL